MSRKVHDFKLPGVLKQYAEDRGLEFHQYNEYHMRLIYGETAILDCWTTRKYWVMKTDYMHGITERGNEKGQLPYDNNDLVEWLDKLFFIIEMQEAENEA